MKTNIAIGIPKGTSKEDLKFLLEDVLGDYWEDEKFVYFNLSSPINNLVLVYGNGGYWSCFGRDWYMKASPELLEVSMECITNNYKSNIKVSA